MEQRKEFSKCEERKIKQIKNKINVHKTRNKKKTKKKKGRFEITPRDEAMQGKRLCWDLSVEKGQKNGIRDE